MGGSIPREIVELNACFRDVAAELKALTDRQAELLLRIPESEEERTTQGQEFETLDPRLVEVHAEYAALLSGLQQVMSSYTSDWSLKERDDDSAGKSS